MIGFRTLSVNEVEPQFVAPEFYENGRVVTITLSVPGYTGTVYVCRDGEALVALPDGSYLRTAEDFRRAVPDGDLARWLSDSNGEDGPSWTFNAWFDLYDANGTHLDNVTFELADAVRAGMDYLSLAALRTEEVSS